MAWNAREALLQNYRTELQYLRRMGRAFAETYPKVASRLEFDESESPDPHVERLIESFAFLTGRIQHNIDAEFPRIPEALLGVLYPQFVEPIPAFSIAEFQVDAMKEKIPNGFTIDRGTEVFSNAPNGMRCRFKTVYPVTLWPIELTEAVIESTDQYEFLPEELKVNAVLRIRLEAPQESFADLGIDTIRIHANGDRGAPHALYDLLHTSVLGIGLVGHGDGGIRTKTLKEDALQPVGFESEDALVPVPPHAQPAYQLLREYFAFPKKFHYVDVSGLSKVKAGDVLDILFLLDAPPSRELKVDAEMFHLFTTPIVNLFKKTSEPIRIDGRRGEYKLMGDLRRESTTQIHSILSVTASSDMEDEAYQVEPFFSFSHAASARDATAFWYGRREMPDRADLRGSDLYMSFVDLDYRPTQPAGTTLFAHTWCTNRGLAEQLRAGGTLQCEVSTPATEIITLYKPTKQVEPPLEGGSLWRLVSHLSLNYLSLSQYPGSLEALREILRLYATDMEPGTEKQIAGLVRMECRPKTARIRTEPVRGFARGVEIILYIDKDRYVGASAILLASVLERFFGLYASINSFTQLTVRATQQDGDWKAWLPREGAQGHL